MTVIVSDTLPTIRSALIVATNVPASSMPSRLIVLNPASVNVTEYMPGRRFSILYWPLASVTTDRTFSMRTGLAASTDTPGSTAPDVSLTVPAIEAPPTACARSGRGQQCEYSQRQRQPFQKRHTVSTSA